MKIPKIAKISPTVHPGMSAAVEEGGRVAVRGLEVEAQACRGFMWWV